MTRQLLPLVAVAVLAAVVGFFAAKHFAGDAVPAPDGVDALVGQARPDFRHADLDGRMREAAEFDGSLMLLNFWATWCAPCVEEMPMLSELQDAYRDRGLRVVGIALDERNRAAAFARDLGLAPGDWERGVELVAAGAKRSFDVGQVESASGTFHFLNIVGAGLPVDVMRFTDRLKVLGRSAYTLGTLWKAMQMRCYPLRIELDGRPLERDCLFVEIANTRFTGTSFLIAPGAEPDDGLLDVILVSRLPRRRVLQLFPSIYEGRHVEYDEVETCQAREVRIVADEPLGLAPDGEIRGEMPVTIRCLHRDLAVFAERAARDGHVSPGSSTSTRPEPSRR